MSCSTFPQSYQTFPSIGARGSSATLIKSFYRGKTHNTAKRLNKENGRRHLRLFDGSIPKETPRNRRMIGTWSFYTYVICIREIASAGDVSRDQRCWNLIGYRYFYFLISNTASIDIFRAFNISLKSYWCRSTPILFAIDSGERFLPNNSIRENDWRKLNIFIRSRASTLSLSRSDSQLSKLNYQVINIYPVYKAKRRRNGHYRTLRSYLHFRFARRLFNARYHVDLSSTVDPRFRAIQRETRQLTRGWGTASSESIARGYT